MTDTELNAKMAEIMGLWLKDDAEILGWYDEKDNLIFFHETVKFETSLRWAPATDMNQAMMVIKRMLTPEAGKFWCKIYIMPNSTEVEFFQLQGRSFCYSNYETERAICLAAAEAWKEMKGEK